MKKIMNEYNNAIDREIYEFVNDVLHERVVLPITVGYFSEKQRKKIAKCINSKLSFAPRCVMDADAIRHIINRHGANGKADHSMKDIADIARLSYVMANFDEACFEGFYSKKFFCADGTPAPHVTLKKQIDGTYYIIEAVTDAKANKSHIVSAYIGNAY